MYLEHRDLSNYWAIDIETDDLNATKVWCIVLENCETGEVIDYTPGSIQDFAKFVEEHPDAIYVGHNAISFDLPCLNRLLDLSIALDRCCDTLVLGLLYHKNMPNGHSLDAWGQRFKDPKIEFNDFSKFTPEMLAYCKQDVALTKKVFLKLTERMRKMQFSELSCKLEHDIVVVIDEQKRNGFYFHYEQAVPLYEEIRAKEAAAQEAVREAFPPVLKPVNTYTYRLKQDGEPTHHFLRHQEQYPALEFSEDGSEYTVYDYQEFNLNSPKQRVERFLEAGWKPKKFTPKGNPKVDEDSIINFAEETDNEAIRTLANYLVLNGRGNQVRNWLEHYNPDTHRIHGNVFTIGAPTRRMSHNDPNTANVAANYTPYGKECRQLWGVPSNRVLVGYDASGLEGRVLCHYLNHPDATEYFLNGDPHQALADALGVSRDAAKAIRYACMYGAFDPKLGELCGGTEKDGANARKVLYSTTPGLKRLVSSVNREFGRRGILRTIDGGFVRCPSRNAALNYKCQSGGSILMKQAAIFLRQSIINMQLDALKVGDIHDEGQLDCAPEDAEAVGKAAVQAIEKAGEFLGFRVPMTGEYKIGDNWSMTH